MNFNQRPNSITWPHRQDPVLTVAEMYLFYVNPTTNAESIIDQLSGDGFPAKIDEALMTQAIIDSMLAIEGQIEENSEMLCKTVDTIEGIDLKSEEPLPANSAQNIIENANISCAQDFRKTDLLKIQAGLSDELQRLEENKNRLQDACTMLPDNIGVAVFVGISEIQASSESGPGTADAYFEDDDHEMQDLFGLYR